MHPVRITRHFASLLLCSGWLSALAALPGIPLPMAEALHTTLSRDYRLQVDTVARGLEHPWGLAFLPDGRMLVTERAGRLRVVTPGGRLSAPLSGVPTVAAVGQGGLLDVALDPDFARNRLVYLSFAEPHEGGRNATAVWRAEFSDQGLSKGRVIFSQRPAIASGQHFGSRLVFDRSGRLFITTGDRGSQKQQAQALDNHIGKVLRIERDGQVPADNPFVARKDALPEIWSYGHRNMQGAALHPQTGVLWTHEHGARGGDEVNLTLPGRNYGWPIITWGVDYSGEAIGEGGEKAGMEQPLKHWEPSIAPSGMAFYTGKPFARWEGSLLVGALAGQRLVRLILADNRISGEEILLRELQRRIRDVRVGPDGLIYLLTDHPDGALLRVSPLAPRQP